VVEWDYILYSGPKRWFHTLAGKRISGEKSRTQTISPFYITYVVVASRFSNYSCICV